MSLGTRSVPAEDTPKRKSLRPRSHYKAETSVKLREDIDKASKEKNVEAVKQLLDAINADDLEAKNFLEQLDAIEGQAAIHTAIRYKTTKS